MTHIIIFRGKCIDTGVWLYGSLVTTFTYKAYIVFNAGEKEAMKEIDPKTIGQYSGRSNKDGVYIYTGDILNFSGKTKTAVTFNNGAFCAFDDEPLGWNFDSLDEYDKPEVCDLKLCTTVGNIHDNPEIELWKPRNK